ncbi:MAG: SCO2322 family protein [Nocardioidaceae bacterium]
MLGVLLSLVLAGLLVGTSAGTADAASGYRYWNYFHVTGSTYTFAQTGAAGYTPKPNSVEAYRYGTSTTAKGLPPRADLATYTIGKICGSTKPGAHQKRVGVLLDYGTAADAQGATVPKPRAACAVVAQDANGQQVLDAVAKVRLAKGLTCAIDGYPASGCGDQVQNAPAPAKEQDVAFTLPKSSSSTPASDSGSSTPLVVGAVVLVVLLVGGGVALTRRNRAA